MGKYTFFQPDTVADLGMQADELADLAVEKADAGRTDLYPLADQLRQIASQLDDLATELVHLNEAARLAG